MDSPSTPTVVAGGTPEAVEVCHATVGGQHDRDACRAARWTSGKIGRSVLRCEAHPTKLQKARSLAAPALLACPSPNAQMYVSSRRTTLPRPSSTVVR